MRLFPLLGFLLCVFMMATFAPAFAALEPSYDSGKPRASTPWYGILSPAARIADLDFIAGMRPHHAGALTMSQDYLGDPDAMNATLKQLARAIMHNQSFEIIMLDTVEGHVKAIKDTADAPPKRQQIATRGLAQKLRFYRMPAPGPLDAKAGSAADITVRDVQFAKAMIIHHQAALDMAYGYLDNMNANNDYLRLMCLEILFDQAQEIALMQSIIDAYPGDADAVKIDDSMIHGMEGMKHSKGHGSHSGHASQAKPEPAPAAHNHHSGH
jgi:uncharacterized protein (DUF305 family)